MTHNRQEVDISSSVEASSSRFPRSERSEVLGFELPEVDELRYNVCHRGSNETKVLHADRTAKEENQSGREVGRVGQERTQNEPCSTWQD